MERISFTDILGSDKKRAEKVNLIAEKIRSAGNFKWVGIYDVRDSEITIIACSGRGEPAFTSFPKDKGLNGRAVSQGKTIIVNDTDKDEDYLLTFTSTKSEIIVPVFGNDGKTIKGTIDTEGEQKNAFSSTDASFLEDCAKAIQSLWS